MTDNLRPEVAWFAQQMESTLEENDHKTGWEDLTHGHMLRRLFEEAGELVEAIVDGEDESGVIAEATDVANLAMFIACKQVQRLTVQKDHDLEVKRDG